MTGEICKGHVLGVSLAFGRIHDSSWHLGDVLEEDVEIDSGKLFHDWSQLRQRLHDILGEPGCPGP